MINVRNVYNATIMFLNSCFTKNIYFYYTRVIARNVFWFILTFSKNYKKVKIAVNILQITDNELDDQCTIVW